MNHLSKMKLPKIEKCETMSQYIIRARHLFLFEIHAPTKEGFESFLNQLDPPKKGNRKAISWERYRMICMFQRSPRQQALVQGSI